MTLVVMMIEIRVWHWGLRLADWNLSIENWGLGLRIGIGDRDWDRGLVIMMTGVVIYILELFVTQSI